jgi:hypothetical protein
VKKLVALALVVAVVGAGVVVVWRATQSGCTADHLPDRIGIYSSSFTQTRTSADQLPAGAVIVDLAGDGTCPALPAGESSVPLNIWLKVSPTRYVEYGRPGGP